MTEQVGDGMHCGQTLAWKRELAGKHYRDKKYAYYVDSCNKLSPFHFQYYSPLISFHTCTQAQVHIYSRNVID